LQTFAVLARFGVLEMSALLGAVVFLAIVGFLVFWGGSPR